MNIDLPNILDTIRKQERRVVLDEFYDFVAQREGPPYKYGREYVCKTFNNIDEFKSREGLDS